MLCRRLSRLRQCCLPRLPRSLHFVLRRELISANLGELFSANLGELISANLGELFSVHLGELVSANLGPDLAALELRIDFGEHARRLQRRQQRGGHSHLRNQPSAQRHKREPRDHLRTVGKAPREHRVTIGTHRRRSACGKRAIEPSTAAVAAAQIHRGQIHRGAIRCRRLKANNLAHRHGGRLLS